MKPIVPDKNFSTERLGSASGLSSELKARTRNRERSRAELIDAARRAFKRFGYINTEIAQISAGADKSVGLFYLYFQNKADLLRELISEFRSELSWIEKTSDQELAERHEFILRTYWATYKKHEAALAALLEAAMIDHKFKEELRALRARGLRIIARIIREMQKNGFCKGLDPQFGASALLNMAQFSSFNWLSRGIDFDPGEIDEKRALDALVHVYNATLYYNSLDAKDHQAVPKRKRLPRRRSERR